MTTEVLAIPGDVVDEAIGWMVAVREGLSSDEQSGLDTWLNADPRHHAAWQRLEGSLNPFRVVETQVSGERLVAALTRQRVSRRAALTNGTMAVGALALGIGAADRVSPLGGMFADYGTATAQRRNFGLPDGSALTLDARSEADRLGERGIALHSGVAFIDVRRGGGPFLVDAGKARAWLTEGALIVSKRTDCLRVICLAGATDVSLPGGGSGKAAAGTGIAVENGQLRTLPESETRDAASWLDGKLILHDRSMSDLIDAFRPYRAGIISISAEAARVPVSGVFDLGRLDDALSLLPELFSVKVLRIGSLFTRIDLAGTIT